MKVALILGDQLTTDVSSLQHIEKHLDWIVMAEVGTEARYVAHHQQKIALIFSAMRHFAAALRENGWQEKTWYENRLKHHCDHEFMTITQNIAELLWEIYESSEDRLHMYIEANKSCRFQPNQ